MPFADDDAAARGRLAKSGQKSVREPLAPFDERVLLSLKLFAEALLLFALRLLPEPLHLQAIKINSTNLFTTFYAGIIRCVTHGDKYTLF